MAYHFTILFPFVSMILRSTQATGHTARSKALTMLLQGLLRLKQASLSGMGRGVAVVSANLLHGFDHVNLQKGVRKAFPLTSQ